MTGSEDGCADDAGAGHDASFDRYARMVRRTLGVPVALVSIVEPTRQVFPGAVGLPEPYQTDRETPLSHSFCQYVVADASPLVIEDARLDDRLRTNLAIRDLGVVAYAGWPLLGSAGAVIGSLCAIDTQPRRWTQLDLDTLEDLASACSAELIQRELRERAERTGAAERALTRRMEALLTLSESLADTRTMADVAAAVARVATDRLLACTHAGMWLLTGTSLQFVDHPGQDWPRAARSPHVPLDGTTPIGAALLGGEPILFGTCAERDARFAILSGQTDDDRSEARAFLPLRAGADDLGTLVLTWPVEREFTDDDRATLAALASYTSQAVQRGLLLAERTTAAITLQEAMLTALPQPDHLELVARYRTAVAEDRVGGDWYDAVVMPSGLTSLMIGDVVGHDIRAAATMGQLRSMLRAIAWAEQAAPSTSVARLDQAIRDLQLPALASLIFARIEQDDAAAAAGLRTLRWTNAGHPPPVLVSADGDARVLGDDRAADPLIGVRPGRTRRDQTVVVEPGATLVLYTDGLVERPGEVLDDGLHRLLDAARRHHTEPVPRMVDALIDDLVGTYRSDDVAVLAVRFHPDPDVVTA